MVKPERQMPPNNEAFLRETRNRAKEPDFPDPSSELILGMPLRRVQHRPRLASISDPEGGQVLPAKSATLWLQRSDPRTRSRLPCGHAAKAVETRLLNADGKAGDQRGADRPSDPRC